jgi:FkbM family methyltransferase
MWKVRSIAERLTHGLAIKRRLPASFGHVPLFVSSEGGLGYFRPCLGRVDPLLLKMAEELVAPGDVVWDVGANVGLFTFAAAACAGPTGSLYAIEPDTWLVGLLRRSARLEAAKRAPVNVLPVAVSDTVGVSRFYIAKRARAANYLESCGSTQTGGAREAQWVVTVTLDWILGQFPAPNVLKIDVERAEDRALAGASRLLSSFRPRILCEVCQENASRVSKILHSFGYVLVDASADRFRRAPIENAAYSTLAYPSTGPGSTDGTTATPFEARD